MSKSHRDFPRKKTGKSQGYHKKGSIDKEYGFKFLFNKRIAIFATRIILNITKEI